MADPGNELAWLPLTDVAARIARGELSSAVVTEALLARIATHEPRLHAFVTVVAARARACAAERDRERAAGAVRGPLHGVPVAVKDLCDTTWAPTTAGMPLFAGHGGAAADAEVVARLEAAGAVIVGKLRLTEGAYAAHHPSLPVPVNPWRADRWSGASSSGSGVATAAALCYAALGSDTGGSIRFPAAMNGVVGVKPTWGRVSRRGVFPLGPSLDHVGPLARTVADAAAVLAAIAGHDAGDATSLAAPVPDYTAALARGIAGIRIGFDEAYATRDMDADVAGRVADCLPVLRDLGARIVPVRVPWRDSMARDWTRLCAAETAYVHRATFPRQRAAYGPELAGFIDSGLRLDVRDLVAAQEVRRQFSGGLAALFAHDIDVLACPSVGLRSPAAERTAPTDGRAGYMRFTAPFDFSGSPTLSLPCGFAADGMPASLQLVGRHLDEATLFAAGHAFERATPWHAHRPPVDRD
jgi:amidase